jgi:predicted O-methyltransferase YrrM
MFRRLIRNFLLTLGFIHPAAVIVALRRGPRAARRYLSEIHRCSKTDAGLHLPIVTLDELAPATIEFVVSRAIDWGGSLTLAEISALCNLVAARRPRKILEIGSFRGLTTLNLARNAPQAELHTLDLPDGFDPSNTRFHNKDANVIAARGSSFCEGRAEALRVRQHRGDSANFDYREIGGGIELCLIDAAHSYEYVRNDTAKVLPLMADDGVLLWHDYGRNDFLPDPESAWGVTRFLHEIADAGVAILQGTSLGVLVLSSGAKEILSRRLGVSIDQ